MKGDDYLGYYRSTREAFRERFDFELKSGDLSKFPELYVPGITTSVIEYQDAMNFVSDFLFSRIGNALNLEDEDQLKQFHRGAILGDVKVKSKAHLSSIFYQSIPAEEHKTKPGKGVDFLMGKHTDLSTMTMLTSSAPGLQIQVKVNSW